MIAEHEYLVSLDTASDCLFACLTRILSILMGIIWTRWTVSACTRLLSQQESEFRPAEPVHVASIQERAEILAAKFTGQSDKPDKPQVEQCNEGLTDCLVFFSHSVLHGLDLVSLVRKSVPRSLTQLNLCCDCPRPVCASRLTKFKPKS